MSQHLLVLMSPMKTQRDCLSEYAYEMDGEIAYVTPESSCVLRPGEAIVKIERTVLPLHVPLLPSEPNYRKRADFIINRSRQNYVGGNKIAGTWI